MSAGYGQHEVLEQQQQQQPHPYLHEPLLYVSNLPAFVQDESLAQAFVTCAPFRPNITRDGSAKYVSGTVEFKFLASAEKALATLQSVAIPGIHPPVPLILSPYPPTNPPTPLPPPSAMPRLIKHLPRGITDSDLYEYFRPFGALASARAVAFGADNGVVEFWREEDAQNAEYAMHCSEIGGQTISVQVYQQRRATSEFSVNAAPFVPSGSIYPYPTQYSPPRANPYHPPISPRAAAFQHGPGQQVQLAPLSGPGSGSHSGLIDPCNLFVKNIDTDIDSNGLFSHFRQFGQIVSARVMRNENGESRGFGFVSYQTPEAANAGLRAMNGATVGTKQLIVRLHEPKQLRQEKLAQRYGHPRTRSGATSPTVSEFGESSFTGFGSPHTKSGSLPLSNLGEGRDRGRRGSGSYFNAALSGTLNLPMQYDDLAALSTVVRKEVLTGELSRRVKAMNEVPNQEVDSVVESLVNMNLADVVSAIHDPAKLATSVQSIRNGPPSKDASPGEEKPRSASRDSRLLDVTALNATASAPEHPSTPVSVPGSVATPPRSASPSGSVSATTERDRIFAAVSKLEKKNQTELAELLMSLPKRERAMCLFNVEVLRAKLADAKMVLESSDGEEEAAPAVPQKAPVTPQAKRVATSTSITENIPGTPDLSFTGPSAAASPAPVTPSSAASSAYTLASLAKLPAAEIIRMANSPSYDLPMPKADPLIVQATDELMDKLRNEPMNTQKQSVGDKMFKVIKSFGIKNASRYTVVLLDQDDLRALAHLTNSYPSVLREKVLLVQAAQSK